MSLTIYNLLYLSLCLLLVSCKKNSDSQKSQDDETLGSFTNSEMNPKKNSSSGFSGTQAPFKYIGKSLKCTANEGNISFAFKTTPGKDKVLPQLKAVGSDGTEIKLPEVKVAGFYDYGAIYAGYYNQKTIKPNNKIQTDLEIKIYENLNFYVYSDSTPWIGPDKGPKSDSGVSGTCKE